MSTEQQVSQLLRKRVIVENKWPGCPYEVGDILIKDGEYYWTIGDVSWHGKFHAEDVEIYPYLMRPLEWWQERKAEEMPEYVKWDYQINIDALLMKNHVQKVIGWSQLNSVVITEGDCQTCTNNWLPATLSDYTNYINQQSK
jgi:hypothetical protein